MTHIIGFGRNKRETYPRGTAQGPTGPGGSGPTGPTGSPAAILAASNRAEARNANTVALPDTLIHVITSITLTPKVSGIFRVWISAAVTGDATGGDFAMFLTKGDGSSSIGEAFTSITVAANATTAASWVTDTDHSDGQQFPNTFPVGTPVTLNLTIASNQAGGHLSVGPFNGTILAEELPA